MEILGIGMPELVFVVIIALIVLGPKDMQKAGKTIGRWLRNLITSDGWKTFQQTSRELRTLPNRLMREANEELNKIGDEINASDPALARFGSLDIPSRSRPVPPTPPLTGGVSTAPPAEKTEAAPPDESESNTGSSEKDA